MSVGQQVVLHWAENHQMPCNCRFYSNETPKTLRTTLSGKLSIEVCRIVVTYWDNSIYIETNKVSQEHTWKPCTYEKYPEWVLVFGSIRLYLSCPENCSNFDPIQVCGSLLITQSG